MNGGSQMYVVRLSEFSALAWATLKSDLERDALDAARVCVRSHGAGGRMCVHLHMSCCGDE